MSDIGCARKVPNNVKLLVLTRFGSPILRARARRLSQEEIRSGKIQELIRSIRYTNERKQYDVGLAAPQVGESVALSVVGRRTGMWEGRQSCGSGDDILYGKALRYRQIRATWYDEHAAVHDEELQGLVAQVFQHETDHLQGVLFVDRVKDRRTFMMADEYRRRVRDIDK